MVGSRLNVHLYRDGFETPWGFRLQGGKDLNQPLVVQRVFSNSPAEGELQRGDVILSINNRDAGQLTHKQAQDLIKHGGGQVQLVVNRPPPGSHVAPLSPPIVTQKPRAPSLQDIRYQQPPLPSRSYQMSMYHTAPSDQRNPHYQGGQMHVTSYPDRSRNHSQPPTPTTPTPPWAAQQAPPKRVSKLSKLGGGGSGYTFGTDFATLPRDRSSSAQYGGAKKSTPKEADFQDGYQETEPDRLASGPVPRVCNLRNLGGGGYSFGSSFGSGSGSSSTLPRRNQQRRLSQPPSMPGAAGYGHMPTKVTMNRLGGGGPDFGSDYGGRYGSTPAQRVQTSLDNITLSPRTPEAGQGSPFYQAYQSPGQQYNMPAQQYQPSAQQYEQPPPEQMYTPTGLLLEQQRLQEQQQDEVRTPLNKPPPRVPRPKPGPTTYGDYGADYSKPQPPKQSAAQWRPTQSPQSPQFKPAPAPVNVPVVQYSPNKPSQPPPQQQQQQHHGVAPRPIKIENIDRAAAPEWHPPQFEDEGVPAWRSTLKSSGVKPWERDMTYQEQQAPRSVPYSPPSPQPKAPQAAPFSPTQTPAMQIGGGDDDGPKIVHLQYNSPMGLYSNRNVAETLQGQTQAMAGQTKPPPQNQSAQSGDRDWSQSSVLRFIQNEDRRSGKVAPPTAPKPQTQYIPIQHHPPQQQQQQYYDDAGASEF